MKNKTPCVSDLRKIKLRLRKLAYAKGVLRKYTGIERVDIGYRYIQGKPTDDLALRIFVLKKKPLLRIKIEQRIPRLIAGMPTDIIEFDAVEQTQRGQRFDNLVGGISAINRRLAGKMDGTLGGIVFDNSSEEPLGLSNWHVFVTEAGGIGDDINQPSTGSSLASIGRVKAASRSLDCAVCTLNRPYTNIILGLDGNITGIKEPRIDMKVVKSGRASGITYGIVRGEGTDDVTIEPDPSRPTQGNQICMGGDSGSIWVESSSGKAVALHYMGQSIIGGVAYAMRMPKVAAQLKFHF